jgi:hypothetical protein
LSAAWTVDDINQVISTTWQVGIGTNAPQSALEVTGDVSAVNFFNTSDERLKDTISIVDSTICYNALKSIPLKMYKYRDNVAMNTDPDFKLGWIAQDVEKIAPSAVKIKKMFGLDDCKNLAIDQIHAITYGSVQKLQSIVEAQADTIAKLEQTLQALLSRLPTA